MSAATSIMTSALYRIPAEVWETYILPAGNNPRLSEVNKGMKAIMESIFCPKAFKDLPTIHADSGELLSLFHENAPPRTFSHYLSICDRLFKIATKYKIDPRKVLPDHDLYSLSTVIVVDQAIRAKKQAISTGAAKAGIGRSGLIHIIEGESCLKFNVIEGESCSKLIGQLNAFYYASFSRIKRSDLAARTVTAAGRSCIKVEDYHIDTEVYRQRLQELYVTGSSELTHLPPNFGHLWKDLKRVTINAPGLNFLHPGFGNAWPELSVLKLDTRIIRLPKDFCSQCKKLEKIDINGIGNWELIKVLPLRTSWKTGTIKNFTIDVALCALLCTAIFMGFFLQIREKTRW